MWGYKAPKVVKENAKLPCWLYGSPVVWVEGFEPPMAESKSAVLTT